MPHRLLFTVSEAANGVILITTKRGTRNNKPKTNFSHQTGYTQFIRLPKKANAVELANLHNQANDNDGTPACSKQKISASSEMAAAR